MNAQFCSLRFRPGGADESLVDREKILSARRALQVYSAAEGVPAKRWGIVFRDYLISDDQLALLIRSLHEDRKYDTAVTCLEAAIRSGRAAPWLYDVLALQMKLAGRDAKQIARVLRSQLDFGVSDIPQLLLTAAVLSRFEAWEPALSTLRDIEQLDPTNPDLWLLARSVADKARDPEAIVWARCGILKFVWDTGFEQEHAEAVRAASAVITQLRKQGMTDQAEELQTRLVEASTIDLKVSISWVGAADLDLIIRDPLGEECSFRRRTTPSLGRLVRETGVAKPASGSREEVFVQPRAHAGIYDVAVRFVLGEVPSGTAVVSITQAFGTPGEKTETRIIRLGSDDVSLRTAVPAGRLGIPKSGGKQ